MRSASISGENHREVESHLKRLIRRLLKRQIEPTRRTRSWLSSIADSRVQRRNIFEQSPSPRRRTSSFVGKVYPDARRWASIETGLGPKALPARGLRTFDQLMDIEFVPGG